MITFNDSFSQATWLRLFKVWENEPWDGVTPLQRN